MGKLFVSVQYELQFITKSALNTIAAETFRQTVKQESRNLYTPQFTSVICFLVDLRYKDDCGNKYHRIVHPLSGETELSQMKIDELMEDRA